MRLSHLAAMATLVALLGAMFVALPSAGAQQPPYVALNLLVDFPQDSDDTIAAGTSTQVRLRLSATDLSSRLVAEKDAKVGDWASLKYDFTYDQEALTYVRASDGLILKMNQEAGVVLAGDSASGLILLPDPDEVTLTPASTPAAVAAAHTQSVSEAGLTVIVPAGVEDDSAVISAALVAGVTVTYTPYMADNTPDDSATDQNNAVDVGEEMEIFVPLDDKNTTDPADDEVDPATRNGSATLNIGNVDEVDSIRFGLSSPKRGSTDPGTTEPAFVSTAGGTTEFTLHVFNANEKPSQINSISSIVVSTTSGTFSSDHSTNMDLNSGGQCGGASTTCELEPARGATAALPSTGLRFLLAAPTRSGTADVRVVVISRAGNVLIDEDQIVTFHGPAAMLEAGEASGTVLGYDVVGKAKGGTDKKVGQDGDTSSDPENPNGDADRGSDKRDQITFKVSAVDKGGTTVVTPRLSARVTGPDDRAVSSDKFVISQTGDLSDTVHLDIDTAASKALKVGEHTIKFSAGSLSGTSSFTVAGTADAMELETSEGEPSEIGETVELTATVTDTDGQPVADGTVVQFNASDKTGDTDAVLIATTTEMPGTMGGVAQVTYVVVGDGSAVVTATVSDDRTPVVRVKVIQSTAGAPEPVVEPEPEPEVASVDCLSNLSGFSTWTCGVDADVSEIFTMVSERGVTAIHLWNGTNWVRYSVVGGSEVPGSSDFMVTKTDILYISQ